MLPSQPYFPWEVKWVGMGNYQVPINKSQKNTESEYTDLCMLFLLIFLPAVKSNSKRRGGGG